ncbi:muscle M-line assembly protein unc-89-like isoform X5 [Ostrea edulis]|uniref:muscle M-line assembly protein unc-89-like isoform X5 n=1 Tax=Ostrea edulis TaxID=37623 RepID=UPI0024AF46FA|nr:muscle M-line assembly protein unc-89-like isoform X5 [Ostrea edulis]XP_056011514.1 muscle M-line assembly protein unc-89-like isoform X5 [Ostrea edulis]
MASSSEDVAAASTSMTEDEQKDKKKKFRPLERMRKFFKSTKKSTKTKDSDKAKSTGALHKDTGLSEEDDEGGFVQRLPMGGTRSISEDSVFKPDQKEGGLESFRHTAASMEQVNQDFRSSSTAKSTSCESDNSLISVDGSETEDDDLFKSNWKSSIASVKKPGEKSTSQGASMDLDFAMVKRDTQTLTSDAAKHRISVKPKSRRSSMLQSKRIADRTTAPHLPRVTEETTKLASASITIQENKTSIQVKAPTKTEELNPKLCKTEIIAGRGRKPSVEPHDSQKTPDKDISKVNNKEKSRSLETPAEEKDSEKLIEKKDEPVKVEEVKSVKVRPKNLMEVEPVKDTKHESNELSKAFKRMSLKKESVSPGETPVKGSIIDSIKEVKEVSIGSPTASESKTTKTSVKTEQATKVVESKSAKSPTTKDTPGKTTYVLKKEPLRTVSTSKSPDYENLEDLKFNKNVTSPSSDYENFPLGGHKSEKAELSSPEPDYDNLPPVKYPISPTGDKFLPKEVDNSSKSKTSTMPQKLSSPREEYRLKRQPRSRTLPEQPVSREILDSKSPGAPWEILNSKSLDVSEQPVKNVTSKTDSFKENNGSAQNRLSRSFNSALSEKTTENKIDIESTAQKVEPKRMSLKSGSSVSATPSWVKSKDGETRTPSEQTSNVSKSNSQEKPKFGQLKSLSMNSAKDKETPQSSNTKPLDVKKEADVSQKPPLKTKPTDIRSSTLDRKAMFENTSSTPSSTVPTWKTNLSQKKGSVKEKEIKIEIIEKKSEKVEEVVRILFILVNRYLSFAPEIFTFIYKFGTDDIAAVVNRYKHFL